MSHGDSHAINAQIICLSHMCKSHSHGHGQSYVQKSQNIMVYDARHVQQISIAKYYFIITQIHTDTSFTGIL
jgi:hypothetical protein